MKEADVLKRVMIEASKLGFRVFRNHTGGIYAKDGTFHRFGLCVGGSDLIGWTPCGRFAALEVKRPGGRTSAEQINFIEQVRKSGGFGVIIDNEKNLKEMFDTYKGTL